MAFSSSSSDNNPGDRFFTGGRFSEAGSHSVRESLNETTARRPSGTQSGFHFDILTWYPKYQSCQRYFLDYAQHDVLVQAFCSFINILLPFQRSPDPIYNSFGAHSPAERLTRPTSSTETTAIPVLLTTYIRRLVATGMDVPQILHGFFGDDWAQGIGPQREQERRNYLFAAKSGGWASVKRDYDMLPLETVPFLRPLQDPSDTEIDAAEKSWSEWLAMEDWMVGSRAPG